MAGAKCNSDLQVLVRPVCLGAEQGRVGAGGEAQGNGQQPGQQRARRHGGPATISPTLWPPAPMSSGKGGNTPRVSDRVSRVGPGQQCPQEVGSLLPPCSLGQGTWDSRPAASPRASWLPDKIGRASPSACWELPLLPYRALCSWQAPSRAPVWLPRPGHPQLSQQVWEKAQHSPRTRRPRTFLEAAG